MLNDQNKYMIIKKSQNHLKNTDENYFQHMSAALKISIQLFIGSIMAIIHALVPSLFTTSASSKIKQLNQLIEKRHKNNYR